MDKITEIKERCEQGRTIRRVDVKYLLEQIAEAQRREKAARNELCLKCGRYRDAHNGACDGCRWKRGEP